MKTTGLYCLRACLRATNLRSCLGSTGLCRLRTTSLGSTGLGRLRACLGSTGLGRLRTTSLMATGLYCLRTTNLRATGLGRLRATSLRATGLGRLRATDLRTKSEASLRHHTKAEPLTSALSTASRLLASALRCRAETEPLTSAALYHTKPQALLAALEGSSLLSAKGCLSIHDSGCSDSGEKDPGDCNSKNLVHSSLLDSVVCGFRFYFIGSSSRIFKNASFPPIQRPASKKISF